MSNCISRTAIHGARRSPIAGDARIPEEEGGAGEADPSGAARRPGEARSAGEGEGEASPFAGAEDGEIAAGGIPIHR